MIARKSLLIVVSKAVSAILSMVCFIFILRFMGLNATDALNVYGSIIFAMSFVATFTFIADLGFGMAHIKRVSEGMDLSKCIGTFATVRLALTGVMVAVILGAIWGWKTLLGGSFQYAIDEHVVYIFILYFVVLNVSSIATVTFDARTESAKSQLSALIEPAIRTIMIVFIGLSGFIPIAGRLYYIAVAYLLGVIALMLSAHIFFRNYPISKPDRKTLKSYSTFALPFIIISIISVVSMYADKLLIGYFKTSIEVGQYAGAQAIIQNLYFISIAVGYVLFPTMSTHHVKKEIKKIRDLTLSAERYISIIITPLVFIIVIFAEEILQLVNAALVPAADAFRILAVAILMASISNPHSNQIIALNKTGLAVKLNLAMAIMFISLCLLLIPSDFKGFRLGNFGILGAAIAFLVSAITGFFSSRFFSKRLTNTGFQSCIIVHIVAGCLMAVCLFLIKEVYHLYRWYELGTILLLGLTIYAILLVVFKELNRKDISFIMDTISPGKMSRYMKTELKK